MGDDQKKRILNVIPVVATTWNEVAANEMGKHLAPGFELHHANVQYGGVESVEGLYYMAVTVPYIVEEILRAEQEGYDAAIVFCFNNPGVAEARELVSIPVVGAGEAACYVGLILGSRLGVIDVGATYRTPSHSAMMHLDRQMFKVLGIADRVVSLRATGFPVEDSGTEDLMSDALYREGQKAIEDGAEVLILGCTGMTGHAQELQKRLEVPVVDPGVASLKFAELLIVMNLSHSRVTIPSPGLLGAKCVMKYPPTLTGYSR